MNSTQRKTSLSPLFLAFVLVLGVAASLAIHARVAMASQLDDISVIDMPSSEEQDPLSILALPEEESLGMQIYAVDLGNENRGDSVIVESGSEILVMDLGTSGSFDSIAAVLNDLDAPLNGKTGGKTLSLYFSHYHNDHTGGLGAIGVYRTLLSTYEVSKIYLPNDSIFGGRVNDSDYLARGARMCEYATQSEDNPEIVRLEVGSTFAIGNAVATVYGPVGVEDFPDPGEEPASSSSNEDNAWDMFLNNCSLVTKITCGDVSFLTTGDIQEEAEKALVKAYGAELKATVLKLAHHGLGGNCEEFLACVRPTYSFCTNNSYTGMRSYAQGGLKVRRTYSAKQKASVYGLSYTLGEEEDGFVVKTDGTDALCYRYSDQESPLAGGIVRTVGSFGEDRGGGDYDFYDYYYLSKSGKPVTGIRTVTIAGVKGPRLFNGGGLLTYTYKGWNEYEGQLQYILKETATLAKGFKDIDGATYYFSSAASYGRVAGVQKIGKDYYHFTDNGRLVVSHWYNDTAKKKNDHWMYFGADGKRVSGLKTIGSDIYYLNPKTGYRAIGPRKISGKYYYFKDSGKAYVNTTKTIDGYKCTFSKKGVWTNLPTVAQPKLLSVKKKGSKKLKVTWETSSNVTGYEVDMATQKSGDYTLVATIDQATTASYTKGSLKSKKTYYFKVRAYKTVMGFKFYSKYSNVVSGTAK